MSAASKQETQGPAGGDARGGDRRGGENTGGETGGETRTWRQLQVGASLTALGLGIAGTASQVVGGVVCLAGWVTLLFALHRGGRLGRRRSDAAGA
jgi:hypothetical protein